MLMRACQSEPKTAPQKISIDQLRPGIFIQLDLKWLAHPFLLSNFKIRNMEQIQTLRELGITEVWWVPEKSDCRPVSHTSSPDSTQPKPVLSQKVEHDGLWNLKKNQIERLQQKRVKLCECEKRYQGTVQRVTRVMKNLLTGSVEAAEEADRLIQEIVGTLLVDPESIVHLMNVKMKDEAVFYHTLNVAILALILARECGLDPQQGRVLGLGALFHDIGKQKIPKGLLYKRGPLSQPELKLIQLHPRYGYDMMSGLDHFPQEALPIILQHHETNNGKGYPSGLKAEEISFLAKITAIVNAYDNLCNRIDPRDSLTPYEALAHMFARQRDQFDHELLSRFISSLGVYPPGTIVNLSNGMIGMVVAVHPGKPLRPTLLLYDPTVPKNEALMFDLDEVPDLEIEGTLRPAQLSPEAFAYLDPRTRLNYFFDVEKQASSSKVLH